MHYKTLQTKRGNHQIPPRFLSFLLTGLLLWGGIVGAFSADSPSSQPAATHVIQISVDALGAKYLEDFLKKAPQDFPSFKKLQDEGASTMNARTDYTRTITLPNHTSMVTSRPVVTSEVWPEAKGHFWVQNNTDFSKGKGPLNFDQANPDKEHISGTFEVAHDHGLRTALYSTKPKFAIFSISFGEEYGTENPHGKNKIDSVILEANMQDKMIADLKEKKPQYVFLHYGQPDAAGHKYGYLGEEYYGAIKQIDGYLGQIFELIENDPEWKDQTVIILTADHGGIPGTKSHGEATHPYAYTIPFFVWGPGVAKGADLYKLNADTRKDPGEDRQEYTPTDQPIRNGDGGNLAMKALGLPPIPGSSINNKQDLKVH